MKKAGKKPKSVAEGSSNTDVKKQISKFEELALAANRAGDDAKCKQYQQKIQSLKQKMSQGVAEGRKPFRDLKSWADHAKSQGLKVSPSDHIDWTHDATDKEGKVRGRFVTTRVPQNSRGFIHQQGVAEGENWSKHNNKRVGGMSKKSVSSYRRSHPGSKIQTAVTTKPSKLKKGSKAAKRRASFCARMRGMKKHRTGAKTARDPNSNINKSLRRWHCESIEELHELVMLAEQFIRNNKK
jgi:hypothetical protein